MNRPAMSALAAALLLSACASQPTGPKVMAAPGRHKSYEVFQRDASSCNQAATDGTRGMADRSNLKQIGIGAVSLLLGAGLGGAINGGAGAAIGAGVGASAGAGLGSVEGIGDESEIQQRYDMAYAQCMAARGNRVPAMGIGG